ncbi:unnamed protein product [Rotaria sordida]|uniref:Uncharacterized protein n=1 Tax=Rotaria sordida TaxID=392033 RepID=A0A815VHH9_9BILA|nr:unnamed protein product [Rotaria sordida]CAF1665253.1 unnamed protein product [Rotaria sordida]
MPKVKKQRSHNRDLNTRRWSKDSISQESVNSSSEDETFVILSDDDADFINFSNKSILNDIADLFSFCKETINTRFISVLMYMGLRHFGHSWRDVDAFLRTIGGMTATSAHKWSTILLNKDFDEFTAEGRGGKRVDAFWDCYPDLELEAKQFVMKECSKTEASFTAESLARFIDTRFYELNNIKKVDLELVRSIRSCRLDLRHFGAKYTTNVGRPYYLGHERPDVIQHREQFVKYFLQNEDKFYTITDDLSPQWKFPKDYATVLLCHDESTYKAGEVSAKRWIMSDKAAFYNKGKGRSIMCSDFLIMHSSGPFFSLTDLEYAEALKKYPHLNDDYDILYEKNSASGSIIVGGDSYFDNQTVLTQFERLFQLLPFKTEYKNHNFVCLVDNARTHTAAELSVNDFGMKPGTKCPVHQIEFIDEQNMKQIVNCYDANGKSKD